MRDFTGNQTRQILAKSHQVIRSIYGFQMLSIARRSCFTCGSTVREIILIWEERFDVSHLALFFGDFLS
jgi:hypothetical protein